MKKILLEKQVIKNNGASVAKKTTTGHDLSSAAQLDSHFEVSMPDYKAMLYAAGFQKGWQVLDAACGTGSFIPFMAPLLGVGGKISAMDLAPENVELTRKRTANLICKVEAKVGNLTHLPYPDNTFDAIWCANSTQFLTNEELFQFFAECSRVTIPGGLIAIKDYDVTTMQINYIAPFDFWRLIEKMKQQDYTRMLGMLRTINLGGYMKQAGFFDVSTKTTVSEWTLPLSNTEKRYFSEFFQYLANIADEYLTNPEDLKVWKPLHDPASPNNPLNKPNFYFRESHMLFTALNSK